MGKRRSSFVAGDDSSDDRPAKVSKKVKKGSSSSGGGPEVDSDGNTFWEVCDSSCAPRPRPAIFSLYGTCTTF